VDDQALHAFRRDQWAVQAGMSYRSTACGIDVSLWRLQRVSGGRRCAACTLIAPDAAVGDSGP
jgi:hypothetical protein